MTKISAGGGGVFNSLATRRVARLGAATGLGLSVFAVAAIAPGVFATGSTNGATRVEMEVATAIAMKIQSPNDVDPDCIAEAGVTYGVANRYASSTGEGGKVVDTFNGNEGEADELNTNTSCAKLSMEPNTYDSTYSDVTVFTNSPSGYALTVQSAENTSPNLVNVSDSSKYVPAGVLTESDNTVSGGQNAWAYKTNNGIITNWTAMSASPAVIKSYDSYTEGGDTTRVTYGISTGNNPTGTYTTELTYTATMFDGDNPSVPSIIPATVSGLSFDTNKLKIPYGATRTITITPAAGHYLASLTCSNGFTCVDENGDPIETGTSATASQIVYVTNNSVKTGSGTIEATAGTSEYTVSASATNASLSANSLTIPYGGSATLTVTPTTGYYLSSFSCPEGYTCAKEDDSAIATGDNATAQAAQTIKVTNNNTLAGGSLTFTGAKRNLEVAITPSINATTSTNLLSIPYGGSSTFTITPNTGYYLTGVTCSSGYTCTGYSTGSASNPSATSRGTQTITVTNNSSTNTGAISFTLDNKYRISFSKTNVSSPSEDYIDVAYGGSATVTVTPKTGYYLSGVTCPEGFTCTGYTTDKSDSASAGAQTITVMNNNTNTTGTLAFTVTKLTVPLSDLTTMQQMTPDTVAETAVGAYKTLTDTRGGSYTVAKLLDGNIWMTQNLNLYNKTLIPEDSDVSSNFTIPNSSTANWCQASNAACDNQSMALYSGNASYGTYYNWYTATAGTGTYEMASGNATSSICPKGWKLPTNAQFQAMYDQYGSSDAIRATGTNQPAYVLSGYRYGGSTDNQGSSGYYWASTASNSSYAYRLYLNSSYVNPQDTRNKWYGFSVRCIAATQ